MSLRYTGVVGLGYVGLPVALRLAAEGHPVLGIDTNRRHVEALGRGETNLLETWGGRTISDLLHTSLESGALALSSEPEAALSACDDAIVTVGIPVVDGQLDFKWFLSAVEAVAKSLPAGGLLLIRSTIPAGTVDGVVRPLLAKAGRSVGVDLFLAYAPERMAEGSALDEVASLPTVVAAEDAESLTRATRLLTGLGVSKFVPTDNIRLAELVKAVENASRDVNIALSNEVAALCRSLGVDSAQLVRVANTHPRVHMLMPGPGVGGHCLPNAHHYLAFAARPLGVPLPLIEEARVVNDRVPFLVTELVEKGLHRAGKSLSGAKVAILGVAMKDFCDDDRFSPAYPMLHELATRGAETVAFDPAIVADFPSRVESQQLALRDADAAVIMARQNGIDLDPVYLAGLMRPRPVLVDTRGAIDRSTAESLGCVVLTV